MAKHVLAPIAPGELFAFRGPYSLATANLVDELVVAGAAKVSLFFQTNDGLASGGGGQPDLVGDITALDATKNAYGEIPANIWHESKTERGTGGGGTERRVYVAAGTVPTTYYVQLERG